LGDLRQQVVEALALALPELVGGHLLGRIGQRGGWIRPAKLA